MTELPAAIMRTITFGDRTISYDTGLDMLHNTGETGGPDEEHEIILNISQAPPGVCQQKEKLAFLILKQILVPDLIVLKTMKRWTMSVN